MRTYLIRDGSQGGPTKHVKIHRAYCDDFTSSDNHHKITLVWKSFSGHVLVKRSYEADGMGTVPTEVLRDFIDNVIDGSFCTGDTIYAEEAGFRDRRI